MNGNFIWLAIGQIFDPTVAAYALATIGLAIHFGFTGLLNFGQAGFMAVGGYDGMRVIYEALKASKGQGGGDALLAAMKGQIFESPRGKIFIDAQTRDIVQDVYLRKVERKDGQLWNVEFDVIKDVKDPGKTK